MNTMTQKIQTAFFLCILFTWCNKKTFQSMFNCALANRLGWGGDGAPKVNKFEQIRGWGAGPAGPM